VLDNDIKTDINVPVNYINLPQKKIATNELPQFLKTTFVGQGWFLLRNRLNLGQSTIQIDLSNDLFEDQVKERSLLDIINKQSPLNIEAITCYPKEILFQFEESIDKKIPLVVPKSLSFLPGYDIKEDIKITPDSIIASGPVSIIDNLKSWQTDTIRHVDLSKSIKSEIGIKDALSNIVFSNYFINYDIDVAQYTEKKLTIEVKLINKKDVSLLIVPKRVELKCLVPINEYDKITANDFSIVADYKKDRVKGYINLKLNKKAKFAKKINYFPKSVEYIKLEK